MTKIKGFPAGYAPSVPLKLVIREDTPYRSPGVGLSPGHYEAVRDGDKWMADGVELEVLMPRFGHPDAQAEGGVSVHISRTDTGRVVERIPYTPSEWVETSPGEFDLQKPVGMRRWLYTQDVVEVLEGAKEVAQSVTAATLDLSKERERIEQTIEASEQQVAQALADTAQLQNDLDARQDANDAAQQENNGITQKVATLTDDVQLIGNNGTLAGWQSESSTFSGWGGPIGAREAFSRVTVKVKPWDAASPITAVRVVVRNTDSGGAILAEATVTGLSIPTGTVADVVADLPSLVGDGSTQLWLEYFANGKTGLATINPSLWPNASGYPTIRYATGSSLTPATTTAGSTVFGLWAELRKVTKNAVLTIRDTFTTALENKVPGITTTATTVTAMATTAPALSNTQISGPAAAAESSYSTFSGWGSPVGVRSAFNYVAFGVDPWSTPITQIRLRVRENDSAGAILADVTRDVSLVTGSGLQTVEFYLPQTINTNVPLYVEYFTNGKTGRQTIALAYNTPTYGQARYSTTGSTTNTTLGAVGSQFNLYFKFGLTTNDREVRVTDTLKKAVDPHWNDTLNVPSALWGVVGREMNVYYANILHSPFPLSHFWIDATNSLNRGKEQEERWTVTPTTAETSSTTFKLSYGGQPLASKTASVKIAAATAGANITRKWLPIGDSTTNASVYPGEVLNLFNNDAAPMRVSIVGTNPGTMNGYTGIKTEGYSGRTTAWLYSDPASPFTFDASGNATGTTFDFARYLSTTGQTMSSGDWATIHIGINDVFQLTDDIGVQSKAQEMVTQLNAMISNMQAAVPGLRIAILECIPPSASQDAFGESYGTNYNRARYRRNRDVMLPIIQAAFEGRTGSGVFYAAFGCALDTVNNMVRLAAGNVNSRSTVQVSRQGNGLHPDLPGYFQMADALYAFFKCQES